MKLIDKDAVLANIDKEIEQLKPYLGACAGQIVAEANSKIAAYQRTKDIMNSLEVKEVDLNFIIHEEWDVASKTECDCLECAALSKFDFTRLIKHYFELGLNASNPLTWKDIKILQEKSHEVCADVAKGRDDFYSLYPTEQSYFEEVLKRFKAQKGE